MIDGTYLEPVLFHNKDSPKIGGITCGVFVRDGRYFKDMDNDGELEPFEDWRLSPVERARDMVAHLRPDQQAGLALNNLWGNPVVRHLDEMRASPNNVHGMDIDAYIDPAVLTQVPCGSYAYRDADGN